VRKRIGKVARWELVVLTLIAVGLFALLTRLARLTRAPDYGTRARAAEISQQALHAVREARLAAGLMIDSVNDPAGTGLTGTAYSLITSGRGDLTAVLTTANPNFAAVVVALLRRAGLRRGDAVALGLSGSLPALSIEVLAACRALELEPIAIATISSGMWGANDPFFNWLDIEALLGRRSILDVKSVLATAGGADDNGRGLSPGGRMLLDSAAARNAIAMAEPASLEHAVKLRVDAYRRTAGSRPIRAYVNVGNAPASIGVSERALPSGIVNRRPADMPSPSVAREMAEQGVRVINLQDIVRLAYNYRFPVAPVPVPPLARGRMFMEKRYPVVWAMVFAAVIVALLLIVIEIDLDYYARRLLGRARS
jgi:poly-gamma-glutamate system protein